MAATQHKQSQQDGEQEEQQRSRLPSLTAVGWGFAGLVLAIYFVWICVQMAGHAVTGGATLIATFGAVALGILAGALAFAAAKRLK